MICRPSSDVRHPKPDALPLHDVNLSENGRQMTEDGYHIRLGRIDRLLSKTRASRRALRPSRETRVFKLIYFIGRTARWRPRCSDP
jgi:hypothetical protein